MSKKYFVKELLMTNNYWVLNKQVVKIFGLETAFLLTNFAEAETMLADNEGWFYQTTETVEKITTLSRYKQDQCIKELEDLGVLEKTIKGMPAKRYFKLNYECLTNLVVNNLQTSMRKINKQVSEKSTTSKESTNKELINKESIKNIMSTSKEVDHIPYKEVIEYLNEKADKNFRNVESNNKHIRARFNEGYNLKDFEKVIDVKTSQWKNDENMSKYLRPTTLFGTKFDNYLNEEIEEVKVDTRNYNAMEKEESKLPTYEEFLKQLEDE